MHRYLLIALFSALPLASHAVEEPDYRVTRNLGNVELRQYAPCVVAEAVLNSTAEDAGSQACPILAGYIFGKNKGEKKFAMTAPVTQTRRTGGHGHGPRVCARAAGPPCAVAFTPWFLRRNEIWLALR